MRGRMPGSENSMPVVFRYVYVLQSLADSSLYVGQTTDLRKRVAEHNRGVSFATKTKRPWELIHYESYRDAKDAVRRERYLKTSQGMRLLKRMLKEYLYATSKAH